MKKNISIILCCLMLIVPSTVAVLNMPIAKAVDSVTPDFSTVTTPPYPLTEYAGNPVMTGDMVTDRANVHFVADPFLFHEGSNWYMFFEVDTYTLSEIGLATSTDGFHWTYKQIVLSESFWLSYPEVFKSNGKYYMTASEGYGTDAGNKLYEAVNFPYTWKYSTTINYSNNICVDPTVFYYNGMWWMFTSDLSTGSNLYLFYASSVTGPWYAHPKNPLIVGDSSKVRGGGRPIIYQGHILRLTQKCDKKYGESVRAFQIDTLTTTSYAEHEITQSPLIAMTGWYYDGTQWLDKWNGDAAHNLDAWWTGDRWLAVADGSGYSSHVHFTWSIGIYTTEPQSPPPQTPTYKIDVSVVGQGSIAKNASEPYVYGQAVTLTATASTGWNFQGWSGDLSGSANPATLAMTKNMTVTATFTVIPPPQPTQITVTITLQPFSITGTLTLNSGDNWTALTTITVWQKTWTFNHWSDGSTAVTRTFTATGTYEIVYS